MTAHIPLQVTAHLLLIVEVCHAHQRLYGLEDLGVGHLLVEELLASRTIHLLLGVVLLDPLVVDLIELVEGSEDQQEALRDRSVLRIG